MPTFSRTEASLVYIKTYRENLLSDLADLDLCLCTNKNKKLGAYLYFYIWHHKHLLNLNYKKSVEYCNLLQFDKAYIDPNNKEGFTSIVT